VPQIFSLSYGYELPWGPGRPWLSSGSLASRLLGGWQVNGITTLRGGFPTDIRTNRLPPIFNTFNVPDRVPGEPIQVQDGRGPDRFFNAAAFRVPGTTVSNTGAQIQMFGDAARRLARGPGSVNFDFSLFKEFSFTERYRLQFRTEAFNLTNTPTFQLPSSNSPPEFGKLTGASATGRQIQFGLKFIF
jgi:hypothetical protein